MANGESKVATLNIPLSVLAAAGAILSLDLAAALVIVVRVLGSDVLATIALTLAMLAFVVQLIVFIVQSATSNQQNALVRTPPTRRTTQRGSAAAGTMLPSMIVTGPPA